MSHTYSQRYKNLVSELVEARKNAGLTQEEVATLLGKHQSFVSKIESGERKIDFIELEDLCQIYKVSIDEFKTLGKNDAGK